MVLAVSIFPKVFGEMWCLCTVTFVQKFLKLNSRLVYCLQLYSKYKLCIFYKDGLVKWVDGGNNIIWFPSLPPIMKQKEFMISGRELTELIIVFWLSLVREIMNISQILYWEKRFFWAPTCSLCIIKGWVPWVKISLNYGHKKQNWSSFLIFFFRSK